MHAAIVITRDAWQVLLTWAACSGGVLLGYCWGHRDGRKSRGKD